MSRALSRQRRCGAVVVLTAVLLSLVLVYILALDLDGGMLLDERRHGQATADASALAGAGNMYSNWSQYKGVGNSAATEAALAIASVNSYPNSGTTKVTVTLHPGAYQDGPNKGKTLPKGYIEVIVEKQMPRYFSGFSGTGTIPVRARAVARTSNEPSGNGIILLDRSERGTLNIHGNGAAKISGSGKVIVNSNNPQAGIVTNENATMYSESGYNITGGTSNPGEFEGGGIEYGTEPVPDPLRFLPDPTTLGLGKGSVKQKNITLADGSKAKEYTYSPGDHRGTINKYDDISGKVSVVFEPGIYLFDQFEWTGQSGTSLDASAGVMIYTAGDSQSEALKITGQGSVSWAPYNDPGQYSYYNGMAFYQNRESDTTVKVAGNGNFNITGLFYAANAHVMIEGNGDASVGSQYISKTLDVGGNGGLTINYNASQPPGIRVLQLVE